MVNVPISDTLALRVVGSVTDEEGWLFNRGTFGSPTKENDGDSEKLGIRASLRWEPADYLTGTFSVLRDEFDGTWLPNFQVLRESAPRQLTTL